MVPEMSVWDRPDIEASIAGQIGTRLDEQICHSVAEDLERKINQLWKVDEDLETNLPSHRCQAVRGS